MASTKYTYSISTDFPNEKVSVSRLTSEIQTSAIITALSSINTNGDDCDIWFKDALSGGDETILDNLVAAHSGEPFEDIPKVELSGPHQADGSPFVSPCMFASGVYLYITGAGDDAVNGRGEGTQFKISRDTAGEGTLEWQYNDAVFMAGGGAAFVDGVLGDWVDLEVVAPATVVTPNVGNTGNCNVVNTVVIVPAAGDGAYDVDLDTAVLVPALTTEGVYNGYWDWNDALIGRGTISAGDPGSAHWHLLTAEQKLIRYANKLPLLGSGDLNLTLPAVEPKIQLPHWKGRVTLHNEGGSHTVKLAFFLMSARVLTV
jgi:hypothetical protein